MTVMRRGIAAIVGGLWVGTAGAAEPAPAPVLHSTSVTLSVVPGLALATQGPPLLQGQLEQLVGRQASVAAFGGAYSNLGGWVAGGQARWLALGNFDANVHLALQGTYVRGASEADAPVGLLVGGKFINTVGFTGEAQLGAGVDVIGGYAFYPLMNVNFGWSF